MKAPLLYLIVASLTLSESLLQVAWADDPGGQTAPASNAGSTDLSGGGDATGDQGGGAEGGHKGKWREAFAQIGLTDAQKEQIRQIRASTSPGRERRQEIMGVLAPDQKEKLRQLMQNYRPQQGT